MPTRDRREPAPEARRIPLDGPLAIEPTVALSLWGDSEATDEYEIEDGVAVIEIEGPLVQSGGWWFDGYESITERFTRACEDQRAHAIALRISSCGGVVSGCYEAVRRMREAKATSGKPVMAYSDERAYSGAYALACVADEIYVPPAGGVGSVGVLVVRYDESGALELEGTRVAFIVSGKQKADGSAELPLTAEERARHQAKVDYLAQLFAEIVATARGMTVEAVLALEAGTFLGSAAVKAKLADDVTSWEDALARVRAKGATMKGIGALRAALAVAASASDEDVLAAAVPLVELGKRTVALTGGTAEESSGIVQAWQSSHGQLAARLESDRARAEQERVEAVAREQRERVELVRGAVLAGKIPPGVAFADETQTAIASAYAEMSIATLRAHVAALPAHALAPTATATEAPSSATASLTPEELAHCEMTKTDPKAFAATKAKLYGARGAQEG